MQKNNQLWSFFASVKLAIFTLTAIAITSIIGTVIPQHQSAEFYIANYGESMARFFQIMDVPSMYTSWWFLFLLGLLCLNLIICSFDRFPTVLKQMNQDIASFGVNKLKSMPFTKNVNLPKGFSIEDGKALLKKKGYKVDEKSSDGQHVISGDKGGWTRTGVYIVHLSIIVIFGGAVFGSLLGFKGNIMIPETQKTSYIFNSKPGGGQIDLGFEVQCDLFDIHFYDNGMPKEYLSRLRIFEDGKEIKAQQIEVNIPLKYKGITFYQASYNPLRNFIINVEPEGEESRTFPAQFQKLAKWEEKNLTFGILQAKSARDRLMQVKLWIKQADEEPVVKWVKPSEKIVVTSGDESYTFFAKQMYATGLQVAKDPGVWIVYLGCFLMMVGLYVAFFMSHRRIWLVFDKNDSTTIMLAGNTNKNKLGFEKAFVDMEEAITGHKSNG